MSRIETRITSVQIVPGFPACLIILDPPGWDAPPKPPSMDRYLDSGSEHTWYSPAVSHSQYSYDPRAPSKLKIQRAFAAAQTYIHRQRPVSFTAPASRFSLRAKSKSGLLQCPRQGNPEWTTVGLIWMTYPPNNIRPPLVPHA